MRTWGRVPASFNGFVSSSVVAFSVGTPPPGGVVQFPNGYQWVEVTTDANGHNDAVWLTTLAQTLQLGLNESPFFGSYGIPALPSVLTQLPPDYYVALTQQAFAKYFLSLTITKLAGPTPTYNVNVLANSGAILMNPVPL